MIFGAFDKMVIVSKLYRQPAYMYSNPNVFFIQSCMFLAQVLPLIIETSHDKTNKMTCVPSKDSDKPGYPSWTDMSEQTV